MPAAKPPRFSSVEDYLTKQDPVKAKTLRAVIDLILARFPELEAKISWNVPTIHRQGKYVAGICAYKNHLTFSPWSPQIIADFKPRLKNYVVFKGTLQIPIDWEIDRKLLQDLAQARLAELDAAASSSSHPTTMTKSKTNPKVDAFFQQPEKWQAEMKALRAVLLEFPLTEELKWGKPCYAVEGSNVVIIAPFKEHCALLFCKGALLQDPKGILIKPGENTQAARQMRFSSLQEIKALGRALHGYIQDAIAVEKSGAEVKLKSIEEHKVPEEFQKTLREKPAVKAAFEALTPGRQRGYLMHFSAPKQSATRESRIKKSLPQILAGKGLNDDYLAKKK